MKKLLFILLITVSGCTTITRNNGAELRQVKLDQLNANSSKTDVYKELGSPSTKSFYGKETWYYISSQTKRNLTEDDEIIDQNVVAITFDQFGIIDNIETYNKNDRRDFATEDSVTPTAGKKPNALEQILGNVGRYNGPDGGTTVGSRAPGGGSRPY